MKDGVTAVYARDEDKKHSIRYRSKNSNCQLAMMKIYVPRRVLGDNIPNEIVVSLEFIK